METKHYRPWHLAGLLSCFLLWGCSGGCQRGESPGPTAASMPPTPQAQEAAQAPVPGVTVLPDEEDCVVIMDADPDYGPPPLTVSFSAEVECTAGEVKYQWDFGDGTTSQDPSPQHTYTKAGDYVATLTVTAGTASASDEIDITVEEDAPTEE